MQGEHSKQSSFFGVIYEDLSPAAGQCGHLCSTVLDDGSTLTGHNDYLTMGMTLVKWRL